MFLYKARIDAQIKRKYDQEMKLESEAYEILREAGQRNLKKSIEKAIRHLGRIDSEFQSADEFLRDLNSLGLTGGFGDVDQIVENIYTPFNDRLWIESQLQNAETIDDLEEILDYEDPGEGGFYDNLGVRGEQDHLVRQKLWKQDPGFVYSPIEWVDNASASPLRHSQHTHALSRYETPLVMKWEGLDPEAMYRIKVVYNGPFDIKIKCMTDEGIVIHDYIPKTKSEIMIYPVPVEATKDGMLELIWTQDAENNILRGVSVSEIWLQKEIL